MAHLKELCGRPDSPYASVRALPHLDHAHPERDEWALTEGLEYLSSVMFDAQEYPDNIGYRCYTMQSSCQFPDWSSLPELAAWKPFTSPASFTWHVFQREAATVEEVVEQEQRDVFMGSNFLPTKDTHLWSAGARGLTGGT